MNDNAELLKFAVENIEEWPEKWTHLRSDSCSLCFFTFGDDWFISKESTWSTMGYYNFKNHEKFSTKTPQVISRNDWEEARKEYTIQLTEEGAKRVFDGLENPPPTNPKLLEAAKKARDAKTNTFTKSMLEAGKHVVVTDDGFLRSVIGNKLEREGGYYIDLDDVEEDLTFEGSGHVKAVYQLVWSREDEEKSKKREILKKEIDSLKAQLKEAEGELRCKTQYLEELK